MSDYTGKKAVVTGGTHGMGRAVVDALLARGAEVVFTGNNEANVERARAELERDGLADRGHVLRSDAADLDHVDRLAKAVEDRLGTVDLLHVNVGYAALEPFHLVTPESYDRVFDVNTKGAFFTVQRLAPLLGDGGAIIFTTSVANDTGNTGLTVYAGAKAAVRAFAKGFATELLPRGIRVNAVSPGFIDTPSMGFTGFTDQDRAALVAAGDAITPMKRHGTVDEVARAVLFLAFDATFTTGTELTVDGGLGHGLAVMPGQ
ncbi:SDR family NAD(P)-dependent oxidoreductase [Saccharothrix variisporea]|uniref:NAD(P)-dependent dehydrogenase (Short-subunit alcohol dehydrogenase family) n=1 Tax=Saccharothrix variisporea TaxID=543527 RepID=A0A495XPK0_9PSEU|nr:SDR family oxidoreductase [Saccharothrix variisporea]RKT74806.1 NAD(P)-dependent dehydrogenase (short-subunit alcohol dehydrogenase family) [Saccharothrix variisporea]